MGIEENKEVRRKAIAAANNGDFNEMLELAHPDNVWHQSRNKDYKAKEVVAGLSMFREIIPDQHCEIINMVAEGDIVVIHQIDTGTVQGEIMNTPPTGRQFASESILIDRFKDSKSVEVWEFRDRFDLYQQWGVIPSLEEIQRLQKQKQTEEANKKLIQEYYDEVINKADYTNIDKYLHDDFGGETSLGEVSAKEKHIQHFEIPRAVTPDMHITINRMIAEGNSVVIHITTTGTHTGIDAYGKPASGKKMSISGINIYDFKDGKIVKGTAVGDMLGLCQQLGVYPPLPE